MKAKFTYVGIRVTDLQKSIDFYTKVLGMKLMHRSKIKPTKGETADLVSEQGGFALELNHYEKDSPYNTRYVVGEGLDHLAFGVDNLERALKEAESAGYRTILELKSDVSSWVFVEDPDGIWVELFQVSV